MSRVTDLLTVVIPTYNEKEELLRKAIESILNQSYPYIELILVNDGCTDNTPNVLEEYKKLDNRVKVFGRKRDQVNPKMRSVSQAFNIGLDNATGKWWHHDAADCWHDKEFAERTIYALQGQSDNIIGAHTDFVVHHYDGHEEHFDVKKVWKPGWTAFQNYIKYEGLGGMVFRMDVCRKAGLWDVRFPRKQTREWTTRVLQLGDLVHVPKELWHFVFHESNQMKRVASTMYRVLGDLKNGYSLETNMLISMGTNYGRLAIASAFHEFFTSPDWKEEREKGQFIHDMMKVKNIAYEEASEDFSEVEKDV